MRENRAGEYQSAARRIAHALSALGSVEEPADETDLVRARLLVTRGLTDFVRKGLDTALDTLEEARQVSPATARQRIATLTYIQESLIHLRCQDWTSALAASDRALQGVGTLEPEEHVSILLNRGVVLVSLGQLIEAAEVLEEARRRADAAGETVQAYKAAHNLATVRHRQGRVPEALGLLREAQRMPGAVDGSQTMLDIAAVLLDAGLLDEARSTLLAGLAEARRDGLKVNEGSVRLDLARTALLQGDPAGAREHARYAARSFLARRASHARDRARLTQALIDVTTGRNIGAVLRDTERWMAVPRKNPDADLARRVRAEAFLVRGDLAGASRLLHGLRGEAPSAPAALHVHLLRARLAAQTGRPDRARLWLRRASALLLTEQEHVASLEVRAGMALHGARLADLDLALAIDSARPEEVLRAAERWRGLSHRLSPGIGRTDGPVAELLAQLRAESIDSAPGSAERRASLEAEISRRHWAAVRADTKAQSTSPVEHQLDVEALTERAAAEGLELHRFVATTDRLHRVSVSAAGIHLLDLGPLVDVAHRAEELTRDVRALQTAPPIPALQERLRSATAAAARSVSALLFPDHDDSHARSAGVVLVPTQQLTLLPWRLLPALSGTATTVATSLTRWAATSTTSARLDAVTVLAGPALARARHEVQGVAGAWPRRADLPRQAIPQARVSDLLGALGGSTVVHIAAHGNHEEENPLFSSLRLHDGPAFAHEFPAPVRAEHVVLSACDVGRAQVRPGDEALGLTAALLALGVRSVVAAVAPVRDDQAEAVMTAYHRELASGTPASLALERASEGYADGRLFCVYGADWQAPPQMKSAGSRKSDS